MVANTNIDLRPKPNPQFSGKMMHVSSFYVSPRDAEEVLKSPTSEARRRHVHTAPFPIHELPRSLARLGGR
jgi:hypothetical protein